MMEAFRLHQHQCLGWFLGIGPRSQLKSDETAAVASLQSLPLLSFMWLLLSLLARQLRIRVRAGTGVKLEVSPSMPEHALALSELHIDICLEKMITQVAPLNAGNVLIVLYLAVFVD